MTTWNDDTSWGLPPGLGNSGSVLVNKPTFGCIIATIVLCLVSNAHADTMTKFDVPIAARQLTLNDTTNIVFDDDSQFHMVAPAAVGHSSGTGEINEHDANAHDNVPTNNPGGGTSGVVLTALALGLIPQPQQSESSVPSFTNPLPPAIVLFGTALVGLLATVRLRKLRGT